MKSSTITATAITLFATTVLGLSDPVCNDNQEGYFVPWGWPQRHVFTNNIVQACQGYNDTAGIYQPAVLSGAFPGYSVKTHCVNATDGSATSHFMRVFEVNFSGSYNLTGDECQTQLLRVIDSCPYGGEVNYNQAGESAGTPIAWALSTNQNNHTCIN